MILDNCPSELHSLLASKVSTSGNKVSLVTIEYDIRDDKPQTTEVIHIEAIGPELLNSCCFDVSPASVRIMPIGLQSLLMEMQGYPWLSLRE